MVPRVTFLTPSPFSALGPPGGRQDGTSRRKRAKGLCSRLGPLGCSRHCGSGRLAPRGRPLAQQQLGEAPDPVAVGVWGGVGEESGLKEGEAKGRGEKDGAGVGGQGLERVTELSR